MSVGRLLLVIPVVAVAFVALGCSPSSQKGGYPLTGTVTLDGQPIPEGNLDFLVPNQKSGPVASAKIENGTYKAYLKEGTWRVQVNATRESKTIIPPRKKPELESYIPARYNSQSTLTVEVSPGKDNHHDFALKTK
jgi:hypothetical protein